MSEPAKFMPEVVVIGGVGMDVMYKAHPPVKASEMAFTSTPCSLHRRSMGGVGRNIAEALTRLGARTRLISVVGNDVVGKQLMLEMKEA